MRYLSACLLVLGLIAPTCAQDANFKEARTRWLRGNYEEARELYGDLLKEGKNAARAAIGVSKCWQSVGKYDEALTVIDKALKDDGKSADLHARRAELLYLRGRWDDADKAAAQAIAIKKDNFSAHWTQARLLRDRGDLKKADAAVRWFGRTYNDRSDNDKEIKDPDELLLVGLAGSENARWNKLSDQFEFIINEIYGEALKQDKDFWPAKYEAGMLFLEKYNRGDAATDFEKALVINPQAAEVHVGKGQSALQRYELKAAEEFAIQALKINPRLVEALHLKADLLWMAGSVEKTLAVLAEARAVNPRDEATLGRLAACYLLAKKDAELNNLVKEVDQHDAKPGSFYFVLGERLEDRRRYEEAEKYYLKSIELRPRVPWPQNNLGMLYMRMGREKEARVILTRAFDADEFNVRVDNTLKVLKHLETYKEIKTEHFILRFDPEHDELLGEWMAKYLEEIYAQLSERFQYHPKGPYVIELFNNHPMFSGRVTALPDLHTIGACTGRIVAMVSPRGEGIRKPFNWARVLRHELVHIFNLDQTHFLVPHWYTEGLAVISEGYPRPPQWNQLLLERVPAGNVLNLDTIDLGFIRPSDQMEWHMAYCQSQIYVEYIRDTYGKEKVGEMLAAFAEGMDTASALKKVCKVEKAAFEKGYRDHLQKVTLGIRGKPPAKAMKIAELKAAYEKDKTDNDIAARLAAYYYKRADRKQARTIVDAVLGRKKDHALACYVKAQLLRDAGEDEQALKLLELASADLKQFEPKVIAQLGKMYFEAAQFDKAALLYERAHKAEPYETTWMTELAKVYTQGGQKDKLIEVLAKLAPTDADDIDVRKRLARLNLDLGKAGDAEKYARQALEIDVLDSEAELSFGDALLAQKKSAAAIAAYRVAVRVREKEKAIAKTDDARLKLARAYQANGQKAEALNEVTKILIHDPNNEGAKDLKGQLEK